MVVDRAKNHQGPRKTKRKLDFGCVSPGQICIFMYSPELEYRGAVHADVLLFAHVHQICF